PERISTAGRTHSVPAGGKYFKIGGRKNNDTPNGNHRSNVGRPGLFGGRASSTRSRHGSTATSDPATRNPGAEALPAKSNSSEARGACCRSERGGRLQGICGAETDGSRRLRRPNPGRRGLREELSAEPLPRSRLFAPDERVFRKTET